MKYRNDWHLLKTEDVLAALKTDMYKGLTSKEVGRRRKKYGANNIWYVKQVSAWTAICESLFDIATLLLIVSAVAAALFEDGYAAIATGIILLVSGILRAAVYIGANRILERLMQGFIPTATVIRDGQMKLLSAHAIVPGDIVFLEAGCTVPCDGRVVSGVDSVVSERGITGNTTPVHKFEVVIDTDVDSGEVPCEYRSNSVFAGSVVLSGNLRIVATACGQYSLIGMLQDGILLEPPRKIPLVGKLESWCKFTSLVMLACVMGITVLSLFLRDGFTLPEIFLTTLAMSVAAMSEYLTVIGHIILAASVHRCAGNVEKKQKQKLPKTPAAPTSRTLIRRPSVLESLADVGRIVLCGSSFFEAGEAEICGYRVGGIYHDRAAVSADASGLEELLSLAIPAAYAGQTGRALSEGSGEKLSERARIVQTAVSIFTKKTSNSPDKQYPLLDHVDASNVFAAGLDTSLILYEDEILAVSCGNIAEVLRSCIGYQVGEDVLLLDAELRKKIFTECAKLEYIGAKIVAVSKKVSEYSSLNRLAVTTQNMIFVGFFGVSEQAEEGMADSLAFMKERSIVPILLSSEPERDLYYCHDLGLMGKRTKVVPYSELEASMLDGLSTAGMIVAFPEMKYGIPASLKSDVMKKIMAGEPGTRPVTAAIGRDVSDLDVLQMADIGFTAAASAYRPVPEPLSRNAAAVVCPAAKNGRGGLAGLLRSVKMAGQALRNIKAAAFYLTSAQIARLAVILSAVLFPTIPLLDTVEILVWGLLFDFAAVLMMAFETDENLPIRETQRTGKFLPISIRTSVGAGLAWGLSGSVTILLLNLLPKILPPQLGLSLQNGEEIPFLCGTILLCGLVMASESMKTGSLFRHVRVNYAFFGFALMTIILTPLILFTGFGASWVGGKPCGLAGLFAFLPALGFLAVWEIVKAARKKKEKT